MLEIVSSWKTGTKMNPIIFRIFSCSCGNLPRLVQVKRLNELHPTCSAKMKDLKSDYKVT